MLLFKISGLLLILTVCSALGILKAESLKIRCKSLEETIKALISLSERIKVGCYERDELIYSCFGNRLIIDSDCNIKLLELQLNDGDFKLLNEFFKGFGMTDRNSEYERAVLYCSLLKERYSSAKKIHSELSRLYCTIGIMSGIILCIIFL